MLMAFLVKLVSFVMPINLAQSEKICFLFRVINVKFCDVIFRPAVGLSGTWVLVLI
jgi:hypothetical protein